MKGTENGSYWMRKSAILVLSLSILILEGMLLYTKSSIPVISQKEQDGIVIAIDAGHGGFDGGFDPAGNGIFSLKEKDINLSIALKLQQRLEEAGCQVIMTRTTDAGLYEESDTHKKRTDMKNRVDRINQSGAQLAVSIHQNSFSDAASHGAQVFYYSGSGQGERLAHALQTQLLEKLPVENHRKEKADSHYYMLKNVTCPIVIAECGFLSNPEEAAKLNTEEYQALLADVLRDGILEYLKEQQEPDEPGNAAQKPEGSENESYEPGNADHENTDQEK